MEFVDGEDLASLLRRIGRPSTDQAMAMCAQIAVGLGAAHRQRVTDRDLKPANIMIDREGVAKVADFGLAVEADRQHGIAGTPAYMAPEQLAGGPVGPKADLYALGLARFSRSLESLREEPGFRQIVERARREQADLRELLPERATCP